MDRLLPVMVSCMLQHINEATWNWTLMRTIFTECHVYDEEKNYVPFDAADETESPVLGAMRKVMPGKA